MIKIKVLSIDGITYPNVGIVSIERKFEVRPYEVYEMLNKDELADIEGTYITYQIKMDVRKVSSSDYYNLYDALSASVAYHDFELPYNGELWEFKGRITDGSDALKRASKQYEWGNLAFTVIAKSPKAVPL